MYKLINDVEPQGLLYFSFPDARFPWLDVPNVVIPVFALLYKARSSALRESV